MANLLLLTNEELLQIFNTLNAHKYLPGDFIKMYPVLDKILKHLQKEEDAAKKAIEGDKKKEQEKTPKVEDMVVPVNNTPPPPKSN